jgi:hypothetical protein
MQQTTSDEIDLLLGWNQTRKAVFEGDDAAEAPPLKKQRLDGCVDQDSYRTPACIRADVECLFGPISDYDPCPYIENWNALVHKDGLQEVFPTTGGVILVNPPYSRGNVGKWLSKCHAESQRGARIVLVLTNSHNTSKQWQRIVRENGHYERMLENKRAFNGRDGTPAFGRDNQGRAIAGQRHHTVLVGMGAHPLQSTTNFEKAKDAKIKAKDAKIAELEFANFELKCTLAAFAKIPFAYDF